MKSLFSRSLFAAFLVVAGYAGSFAQTTVTLPTIPCSNCNGPGAFATSAPACTSGLVGAPLTMSWGAATGATSYTILIATDATLSQNVATFTTTGTSVSVPAIGLAPSTTYYWTVFANSAAGSTKATGGPCTFSTNTTWKATSATGAFPNGTLNQQLINNNVAGGYSDCRSGDGTCASGDNMVCNPQFQTVSLSSAPYVPNWAFGQLNSGSIAQGIGYYLNPGVASYEVKGVNLGATSAGIPSTGTQTGVQMTGNGGEALTPLYVSNTSSAPMTFQLSLWIKGSGGAIANYNTAAALSSNLNTVYPPNTYGDEAYAINTTIPYSASWTQYTRTISIPAGGYADYLRIAAGGATSVWITDVRLCKL